MDKLMFFLASTQTIWGFLRSCGHRLLWKRRYYVCVFSDGEPLLTLSRCYLPIGRLAGHSPSICVIDDAGSARDFPRSYFREARLSFDLPVVPSRPLCLAEQRDQAEINP